MNGTFPNVSTSTVGNTIGNTTEQTIDEEKENDRKLMIEWTKMFFSMGRVPQQGAQMLIFPGLFSKFEILSFSQLPIVDNIINQVLIQMVQR